MCARAQKKKIKKNRGKEAKMNAPNTVKDNVQFNSFSKLSSLTLFRLGSRGPYGPSTNLRIW